MENYRHLKLYTSSSCIIFSVSETGKIVMPRAEIKKVEQNIGEQETNTVETISDLTKNVGSWSFKT